MYILYVLLSTNHPIPNMCVRHGYHMSTSHARTKQRSPPSHREETRSCLNINQ